MNALERLKLIKRLRELRMEAVGLGAGGAAAMRKLKIAKETREIRQKLGLVAAASPSQEPAPAQAPSNTEESPHIKALRDVASGGRDGDGLMVMLNLIEDAVKALDDSGMLDDEAQRVANEAITHWAQVEERLNG